MMARDGYSKFLWTLVLQNMKRFLFNFLTVLLCSSGIAACGTEEFFVPEKEIIISNDTTIVFDTIINPDTTFITDTIIRPDTIIQEIDTIIKMDTIIMHDTIIKKDTVINNKSIITKDTIKYSGIEMSYYMDQGSGYSDVQGSDCYGKYLFQFQNNNSNVYIYNLEEKTLTDVAVLSTNSKNHCNNVSFSNISYNENDLFPLLYVSGSPSGTYNHVQVYRIIINENKITLQKIQEITLPDCNENNHLYWTGVVMDNTNNFMYIYANHQGAHIAKLEIPDINQPEVVLTDNDILEQFSLPGFTHQQGACINNNMMFILDGVPQWGDTNYLRIIDLKKRKDIKIINISDFGYGSIEFEGISYYNNCYILTTNLYRGIYSLKLNLLINE